jgi:GDP-L-fucose synthase
MSSLMQKNDLIYVAGHTGLIGSAIVRRLEQQGFNNLLLISHAKLELTDSNSVNAFFSQYKPKFVFLAAGRVGGIIENQTYPADFIRTNLAIQLNVLDAAHRNSVEKLVLFGSSCMYPRECPQPMPEDYLLSGKPEPTSIAYAIAKLAGVQMCLSYNKQFGKQRFIPIIPNSVYGPNDNFDLKVGHVLSALVRRFHEAKQEKVDQITLWGTGAPRREFIHADDIADASIWLLTHKIENLELPINIGVGTDFSIRELAKQVAEVVGYRGAINWDTSKPNGAPRKLLDSRRIKSLGWEAQVQFKTGLKDTYQWYLEHAK